MNFTIRPGKAYQIPQFTKLWLSLMEEHEALLPHYFSNYRRMIRRYEQTLMHAVDSDYRWVIAAARQRSVLGFITVYIDDHPSMYHLNRVGFLGDVIVHADYRGQGIGKALIDAGIRRLELAGADLVEGYVLAKNKQMLSFMKGQGFTPQFVRYSRELSTRQSSGSANDPIMPRKRPAARTARSSVSQILGDLTSE